MLTTNELHNDLKYAARKLGEGWSVVAVRKGMVLAKGEGRRLMPALMLLHELGARTSKETRSLASLPTRYWDSPLSVWPPSWVPERFYGELVSRLAVQEARP